MTTGVTWPTFREGDTERNWRARDLNFLVEQVRKLSNISTGPGLAVKQTRSGVHISLTAKPQPPLVGVKMFVQDIDALPDRVMCKRSTEPWAAANTGPVWLPYLLRRTPFDEDERNGIAYNYTSNTERIARKQDSEGNETTETQVIIPRYVLDDAIYMIKGVEDGEEWIDLNVDGRYWARKSGDGSE